MRKLGGVPQIWLMYMLGGSMRLTMPYLLGVDRLSEYPSDRCSVRHLLSLDNSEITTIKPELLLERGAVILSGHAYVGYLDFSQTCTS